MPSSANQGITRRDLLKKGAVLGGAVVWVTPIVQSVGMGRAFAQAPSPCTPGISYIAMNVTCDDRASIPVPDPDDKYFIKWEDGQFMEWEANPGSVPGCEASLTPLGTKIDGDLLGFSISIDSSGIAIVTVGPNCTVDKLVVKGGQICQLITSGLTGTFTVGCPTG